jgi:hypothetical protein
MSKKKSSLTPMQLSHLSGRLRGKTLNIYREVMIVFDIECTDEIFEQLRQVHGLAKCIECNTWKEIKEGDVCEECDIEMHSED